MNIIDTHLTFSKALTPLVNPELIILHHEAAPTATVEEIHRFHQGKGWGGIAYHLYIRKNGLVYQGRPLNTRGTHTTNYNYKSIGVCCEGNFENESMLPAQRAALLDVIAYLQERFPGIKIAGHREVGATACPGRNFPLQEVRSIMVRYNRSADILADGTISPDTAKLFHGVVDLLMSAGVIAGDGSDPAGNNDVIDLSKDMVRQLVFEYRAGVYDAKIREAGLDPEAFR